MKQIIEKLATFLLLASLAVPLSLFCSQFATGTENNRSSTTCCSKSHHPHSPPLNSPRDCCCQVQGAETLANVDRLPDVPTSLQSMWLIVEQAISQQREGLPGTLIAANGRSIQQLYSVWRC